MLLLCRLFLHPEEMSLSIFPFTETHEKMFCHILVQGKLVLLLNKGDDLFFYGFGKSGVLVSKLALTAKFS